MPTVNPLALVRATAVTLARINSTALNDRSRPCHWRSSFRTLRTTQLFVKACFRAFVSRSALSNFTGVRLDMRIDVVKRYTKEAGQALAKADVRKLDAALDAGQIAVIDADRLRNFHKRQATRLP